jgi:hypothetical protein
VTGPTGGATAPPEGGNVGYPQAAGITYRSTPRGADDMQINRRLGGKNLYWQDADRHLCEILTGSYARPESTSLATTGPAPR